MIHRDLLGQAACSSYVPSIDLPAWIMFDSIAILDFGSQFTQLIARRLRELHVYCEIFPWNSSLQTVLAIRPHGFILSGGPASVYDPGAPSCPAYVIDSRQPILGICYGMQAITNALGGLVASAAKKEYGSAQLETLLENPLTSPGVQPVWMSHADRIEKLPPGFITLGRSENSPVAFMGDLQRSYFGLQFHPEVQHTPGGIEILKHFVLDICHVRAAWTPESIISDGVEKIRRQVGSQPVLSAVSGGVDSSVAAALVQRAVGDQLVAVFIDTGLLRQGEVEQVSSTLHQQLGVEMLVVDAVDDFLHILKGVTSPEKKRSLIGEHFIRLFEAQALQLGNPHFLVQGTIYPDVVESSGSDRSQAQRIKTHHNVGGLPDRMNFELVEPLRYLFKDEVRAVGLELGLPPEILWRQPFPGPGLAVRCLGEITSDRLERVRHADHIFTQELAAAGFLHLQSQSSESDDIAQAFAVLLPVHSVGVMGDQRTYEEVIVLRAVTTQDFMTADWARLPEEFLSRVANRIVNEVQGVNRVVYDITSKPPGTIEWE